MRQFQSNKALQHAVYSEERLGLKHGTHQLLELDLEAVSWPVDGAFTIARGSKQVAEAIVVRLVSNGHAGRGECVPYTRYGETLVSVERQIRAALAEMGGAPDRARLQEILPAGAARNALDCALWDLEAKTKGVSVAALCGFELQDWVETAFTLSLDTPEKMRMRAIAHENKKLLKLKLSGNGDLERVAAVRAGAPNARIIVDANESWTVDDYHRFVPRFEELGVSMIEQPFPATDDQPLQSLARPIPICADESCHTRADLPRLAGLYDMINIKLDKAGGLTEGIALLKAGRTRNLAIMIGCMLGSSLAIAPARLLAPYADIADIDGPLLLAADHEPSIPLDGDRMGNPAPALWG